MRKNEILRRKSDIDRLFAEGTKHTAYPLLMMTLELEDPQEELTKVIFTIPKRRFRLAVTRNLLRRRLREAYRLNKNLIPSDKVYHLGFVYTGKEQAHYQELEAKIIVLLKRLSRSDEEAAH